MHPFHRAILANPLELTARLAYADWLEERDPPDHAMAAFVRTGDFGPFCSVYGRFADAVRDALPGWGNFCGFGTTGGESLPYVRFGWRDGPHEFNAYFVVRDGFVQRVEVPAAAFTPWFVTRAFAAFPITNVKLYDKYPDPVDHGAGQAAYRWYHWWSEEERGPAALPAAVFRELRSRYATRQPNPEAAHAALDRSCVSYGRRLARLPPLDFPAGH